MKILGDHESAPVEVIGDLYEVSRATARVSSQRPAENPLEDGYFHRVVAIVARSCSKLVGLADEVVRYVFSGCGKPHPGARYHKRSAAEHVHCWPRSPGTRQEYPARALAQVRVWREYHASIRMWCARWQMRCRATSYDKYLEYGKPW